MFELNPELEMERYRLVILIFTENKEQNMEIRETIRAPNPKL